MTEDANAAPSQTPAMGRIQIVLICALILLAGAGVTALIFFTEPTAQQAGATKETAMLVEVTAVQQGTFRPTIVAMGTVAPSRDIILSPRVGGQVTALGPGFMPGGFVADGQILLRIDPADYENRLAQRRSELRQAMADLDIEMGRQKVARKDYQLLDEAPSDLNEALVLREPQLNTARARVAAVRADVAQAQLDLSRTRVEAPFDAHVLRRNVHVGSQVAPGDDLGRLVGMHTYWVEATVPVAKLRWLGFPAEGRPGAPVLVRDRAAWPAQVFREGRLAQLIGALADQTRMARVLITVDDPLARRTQAADRPALMIGAFVEARIQAKEIRDVVRLERDYVRAGDTVWVMQAGRLEIREVAIAFSDARYAYIRSGLSAGDQVVTTNLTTVADGARLRLAPEAAGAGAGGPANPSDIKGADSDRAESEEAQNQGAHSEGSGPDSARSERPSP